MDNEKRAWDRKENEPYRWYELFIKYYVGMGFGRSVHAAWLRFLADTDLEKHEKALLGQIKLPKQWLSMSVRWSWHKRVEAWERYQSELSMAAVEAASRRLMELAPSAVQALADALHRDKEAVRAASEILNRGGLPAVSKQEVDQHVQLSSDDMAAAAEELRQWEEKKTSESG